MKRIIKTALILILGILITHSCKLGTAPDDEAQNKAGTVTITGTVVDSTSGRPIEGARVSLSFGSQNRTIETKPDGTFLAEIQIEENVDLWMEVTSPDYKRYLVTEFLTAGSTIDFGRIIMTKKESAIEASGGASSIVLYSQSVPYISVKGTGYIEVATLTFIVQDSSGRGVDIEHQAEVFFSIGGSPGGGEFLSPASDFTNDYGQVKTSINSGSISGVVQVIAEINTDDKYIRSEPIPISIHNSMPDPNHFHVASEYSNYPALGILNYDNGIIFTAFVGDEFSNPVRPGTSVKFSTTSGIVYGSGLTNEYGAATTVLTTQPWPDHPVHGPGFFVVSAETISEDDQTITTTVRRLQSGFPQITVISPNPPTIDIPNAGQQSFTYEIADINGNPLSSGNSYTVTVSKGDIEVDGATSIQMIDTQSRGNGLTLFSFIAYDVKPDTLNPQAASIVIKSNGPNGINSLILTGTCR